ncbi:MAG TPA: alpha-glucosidase/alpha-galactosidase [Epulopiscium sp.]|nr:alpha-glucosidase/alpha-galactosidase [Candidatus Epulonipiscium sp.]
MAKITFIGAGSTVFAKNVLGDCMVTPALRESEIALFDIDPVRLQDSYNMLNNINKNSGNYSTIKKYTNRKDALKDSNYVVNAIQVGGYDPCTITDFEIPKKYGLRQTIGDTLGIGGIFRGLRTIPVVLDILKDMEEVCPNALFLNYTNPMSIIMSAVFQASPIKAVGLCHSVQDCIPRLFKDLEMDPEGVKWHISGINHQAWLLDVSKDNVDLYPEIKKRAAEKEGPHGDMVRYEMMKRFGYYITESSEHGAEYVPYFIKSKYPDQIERWNIPLDEYPRRCIEQIGKWEDMKDTLVNDTNIEHKRSHEYASYILEAMETDVPYRIHGNVLNTGLITNLPKDAVVEVPCLVDRTGINPCYVGDLPQQLAALNRTNINVHLLTAEAALTKNRELIYMAAMLDPHTGSELSMDEIRDMCDELIEAHGDWLPEYL